MEQLVGVAFLALPYVRIMNMLNTISRTSHFVASAVYFGYHANQYYIAEHAVEDAGDADEY